jgi:putative membrane protein
LSRSEAERLRQAVFERARALQASDISRSADSGDLIKRLTARDLVLAGLTSNHLVTALAVVAGIWAFVDDILPETFYERVAQRVYSLAQQLLQEGTQATLLVTLLALALVFVFSMILSVVGTIVLFYGFTLSRRGEDLQRFYGLFTRRSISLPRRRIQVLEIEEGFLRRLAGLATLRADSAGSRERESGEKRVGRDMLLPVVRRAEVEGLLTIFFPDLDRTAGWNRVSRKAITRGAFKGGLFCVLLTAALFAAQQSAIALWPLALLPLVYAVNVMRYYNLGYSLGDRYFSTRRGWLSRSTHIVPVRNTQAVVVHQSPFDKRLGLATLIVDTAGQAYTGGGPLISNLPLEEANAIARTLALRAATTRYKW